MSIFYGIYNIGNDSWFHRGEAQDDIFGDADWGNETMTLFTYDDAANFVALFNDGAVTKLRVMGVRIRSVDSEFEEILEQEVGVNSWRQSVKPTFDIRLLEPDFTEFIE